MFVRFLSLIVVLALASGCGLKAKTYVMTKERVGIEKGTGNAGYLSGTPQYIEPQKKTRQVYILEITKSIPESEAKKIEQEVSTTTKTNIETVAPAVAVPEEAPANHGSHKIVIPRIEDEKPEAVNISVEKIAAGPKEDVTYTVQKDDTLQKIAKKHYGSYSAWMKIYKANKEKIKNPNLLKAGTVLTLPAVK
jgi:nucleoid-associated protein YgaU